MLRKNIAIYIGRVGVQKATDEAFEKIINTCVSCSVDQKNLDDMPETVIGILKFHTAVLEYLNCDDGMADEFCMAISKTKV